MFKGITEKIIEFINDNLFEKKFRVKIWCNYGLTETSSIVATENLNKKSNLGSVGKPLFNNKIKIVNIKKENDYKGEIIVKGENNFLKYINKFAINTLNLKKIKIGKKFFFVLVNSLYARFRS